MIQSVPEIGLFLHHKKIKWDNCLFCSLLNKSKQAGRWLKLRHFDYHNFLKIQQLNLNNFVVGSALVHFCALGTPAESKRDLLYVIMQDVWMERVRCY